MVPCPHDGKQYWNEYWSEQQGPARLVHSSAAAVHEAEDEQDDDDEDDDGYGDHKRQLHLATLQIIYRRAELALVNTVSQTCY
jgi:hypothetical protein